MIQSQKRVQFGFEHYLGPTYLAKTETLSEVQAALPFFVYIERTNILEGPFSFIQF